MKSFSYIASVMLVLLLATYAQARLFYVPSDFDTIQEAIDGVQALDTILVSPGTYRESLNFHGQNIVVIGVNRVELVPDAFGSGIIFANGESRSTSIHNFYFHDFLATDGGAVSCTNFSSPSIMDCTFERCRVDSNGGAVFVEHSRPLFENCMFLRNTAKYGGALALMAGADCQFTSCFFSINQAFESGGAAYVSGAHPTFERSIFKSNTASNSGGGIFYSNRFQVALEVNHCTFFNNQADLGRTIFAYNHLSLNNSIFWHDESPEIYLGDHNTQVLFCDIKNGVNALIGSPMTDGIISDDPLFIDPEHGDFHLRPRSPCIDAGNPRSENDEDGTRSDLGALPYFYPDQPLFWHLQSMLDFGRHGLRKPSEMRLLVTNVGRQELEFEIHQPANEAFSIAIDPNQALGTRDTLQIPVLFTAESASEYSDRFRITTNDPSHAEVWIDLHGIGFPAAELIVEPEYVSIQIDTASCTEFSINLSNEGLSSLEWIVRKQAWFSYPSPTRGDRGCPPQPDRLFAHRPKGSVLRTYNAPYSSIEGMTWDGSRVWSVADYLGSSILSMYNPENMTLVQSFNLDHTPRGLAYANGQLWLLSNNYIYSYSLDGQELGYFQNPLPAAKDFCADDDFFYIVSSQSLWIMDRSAHEVIADFGIIQDFDYETFQIEAITYSPNHSDAPIGVLISTGRYGLSFLVRYRLDDRLELIKVEDVWLDAYGETALCHDGNNFIHPGNTGEYVFFVIEDEIEEPDWLTIEAEARTIEPDADTDLFIIIDTSNLKRGDYGAILHVLTNDPDSPDNLIPLTLTVADPQAIGGGESGNAPRSINLAEVFPNPCNGTAMIHYALSEDMTVVLSVVDVQGRLVATLCEGFVQAGEHQLEWQPDGVGSGTYFVMLKTRGETIIRKILYLQ